MSRVAEVGVAVAHSLGAVAVPERLHRLYCIGIAREQMPRQLEKLAIINILKLILKMLFHLSSVIQFS